MSKYSKENLIAKSKEELVNIIITYYSNCNKWNKNNKLKRKEVNARAYKKRKARLLAMAA